MLFNKPKIGSSYLIKSNADIWMTFVFGSHTHNLQNSFVNRNRERRDTVLQFYRIKVLSSPINIKPELSFIYFPFSTIFIMLKISLLLTAAATACLASFLPVSPYIGKHSQKCGYALKISGAKVNDKLYTFGGCYPIPYVVDPASEDAGDMLFNIGNFMGTASSVNVSDTIQIYDFAKDSWTDETTTTPIAWRKAELQVVNNRYIYAHSAFTRPAYSAVAFWKYDTETKDWSQLPDLPFLWHGVLRSCAKGNHIYFGGSDDGAQQNIIHTYNTETQTWGKPVILSKKLNSIKDWICGEEHIHFFAQEASLPDMDNAGWISSEAKAETFSVFSADYLTGLTTLDTNVTGKYEAIAHQGNTFYLYDVGKNQSVVSKLNVGTSEHTVLGTLPYTLEVPLLVPHGDEIFFFGGGEKNNFGLPIRGGHVNKIKKYNHKLVVDGEDISAAEETSEEEGHVDTAKLVLQE